MKNYYFFNGGRNFFLGTTDLKGAEKEIGISCIYERYTKLNGLLEKANRLHTSVKINEIINLPFRNIWNKYDELHSLKKDDVLIVTDSSIRKITLCDLRRFDKKGIAIYLLFLNTAGTQTAAYALQLTKKFDFKGIYTIDLKDADKYGFKYTNQVYFMTSQEVLPQKEENVGLFFVGNSKGRLATLLNLNKLCDNTTFFISSVDTCDICVREGITYNHYIEYDEVLAYVLKCDCILEIVQEGQVGLTFRDYEAICYNKKLLTNNKAVFTMQEYNPNYIQYFKNIDDIDMSFITSSVAVDYRYDGEYSPRKLIDAIKLLE